MRHPLLYIGLIGFEPSDRSHVAEFLRTNTGQAQELGAGTDSMAHPIWEVVDYREADALLINGAAVSHVEGDTLHFSAQQTLQQEPLAITLSQLQAPCAIRLAPVLHNAQLPASSLVDSDLLQPAHLLRCIQRFETVLRPLRSIYALAAELTERQNELDDQRCHHLEHDGQLVAIIDIPQRRIKIRPGVRPVDIESAAWMQRPRQANFAPPDFLVCHMEEVAWLFAMHTPEFLLPKRYATKPIYMRRLPRVRPSMLYRRHGFLIESLSAEPATLEMLQDLIVPTRVPENPGLEEQRVVRDLFALYLCRAITTQPQKEAVSSLSMDKQDDLAHLNNAFPHSQLPTRLGMVSRGSSRVNTMAAEL
jgi:hypothetical protein